jgi:hypothetical protein
MGNALVYAKTRAHTAKDRRDSDKFQNAARDQDLPFFGENSGTRSEELKILAKKLETIAESIQTHAYLNLPDAAGEQNAEPVDSILSGETSTSMDADSSSLPFPRLIERGMDGCGQNTAMTPPLCQARDRAHLYGVRDDAAHPKACQSELSQKNEESQKLSNGIHLLLACTASTEEWISMAEVEAAFLQRCGEANVSWFREVRSYATARGYVDWGKLDLDDMCFGDSEIEVSSPSDFDEAAKDAQLRVTNRGRETLSQWESSRTPSSPSFGHDSPVVPTAKQDDGQKQLFGQKDDKCHNGEEHRRADGICLFLECATSTEDWISMDEVEAAFLQRCGEANVSWFREVRSYATARGYVDWGKLDLDDMCFGDSEIEVASPSDFDEAAKDAQLRVTNRGRETLSQWESSRTPSFPSFGHDSHMKKVFSKEVLPSIVGASGHNVSAVASVSNTGVSPSVPRVSPPLLEAYPRCPDVKAFLDCIFTGIPLDDNLGWVNMMDAVARFAKLYGPPVTATFGMAETCCLVKPDFERFLKTAGLEKLVSWGRGHPSTFDSVQVVTFQQVEGHSVPDDTFLRLTDKGRKVVFHFLRDEVGNSTAPDKNSDVTVMSELREARQQHKRGYDVLRDKSTRFVASSTTSSDSVDSNRRPSRNEQGTPQRSPNFTSSLSATGNADQGSHNHDHKRSEGSHGGGDGAGRSYHGPSSHGQGDPHAAQAPSRRGSHQSSDGKSNSSGSTNRYHSFSSPRDHARILCQIVSEAKDAALGGWSLGGIVAVKFHAFLKQRKGSVGKDELRTTYRNAKRLAEENGWISHRRSNTGTEDYMKVTREGQIGEIEALEMAVTQTSTAASVGAFWFLPNKKRPCKNFRNSVHENCPYGRKCKFAHIQPRHGRDYTDYWYADARHMKVPSLYNVYYTERRITGVPGEQFEYSAAYQDPETNIYYVAEGGKTFDDGAVCWYPSKEDAKAALEFAFRVSTPECVRQYERR